MLTTNQTNYSPLQLFIRLLLDRDGSHSIGALVDIVIFELDTQLLSRGATNLFIRDRLGRATSAADGGSEGDLETHVCCGWCVVILSVWALSICYSQVKIDECLDPYLVVTVSVIWWREREVFMFGSVCLLLLYLFGREDFLWIITWVGSCFDIIALYSWWCSMYEPVMSIQWPCFDEECCRAKQFGQRKQRRWSLRTNEQQRLFTFASVCPLGPRQTRRIENVMAKQRISNLNSHVRVPTSTTDHFQSSDRHAISGSSHKRTGDWPGAWLLMCSSTGKANTLGLEGWVIEWFFTSGIS